jgi:antitoxin component YwqK of YwqJK toxin-antitoxin module
MNTNKLKNHIVRHTDGSVWAKGKVLNGLPEGYWEWFRKDGAKMRSGSFKDGKQVGEWITYDKSGTPYRTTNMDKKSKK